MDAVKNTPHAIDNSGISIRSFALSPNTRSSELSLIAKELLANWNVGVAFELRCSTEETPFGLNILASRYETIPDNLQQWATNVGLKCITTGETVVDSSLDANSETLHLIAIPSDQGLALISLFVEGSEDLAAEFAALQAVLPSAGKDVSNEPSAANENISAGAPECTVSNAMEIAEDIAAIQALAAGIGAAKTLKAACQKMTNTLAKHLPDLDDAPLTGIHVFAATIDNSGKPNLVAFSESDSVPQPIVEPVEAAMAECLSRRGNTHWPPIGNQRHALLCHRRVADELKKNNLASFALTNVDGDKQAVLLVASDEELSPRCNRFLAAATEPFGAILSLVQRAEHNRLQRWISSLRDAFKNNRTRMVAKCVGVIFALGLIPIPYQIWTDCEVQPTSKQFVCAPFDTKIKNCFVEPGDYLEAGQSVAQLDNSEIQLELAEVAADYHRVLKKRDGFVASHESGEANLAHHETEMLRAKNDLLAHRANNLDLKSPIAGVVIAGDLKDSIGMPVQKGQSLFEIAPLTAFTIDVFIPQSDILYAKEGMPVRVSLDAFPFESWTGVIQRVHPASEIHDNKNVFVATVAIEDGVEQLRPGMQGSATISSVWRPIWWNLLHKPAAKCLRYVGW